MIIDICCNNFKLIMNMGKVYIRRKEKWFQKWFLLSNVCNL